ncbi:hypothetical protein [Burkholderia gladioli]|uniref:hypothetical protein n=1 Tax=Burkholderia gladioli TaxID=28095 RepID=UPI0016402182|nr:hypothetical protein [Burkholderia gladioli]MBU9641860.1 hypothetical protein [Burkholderia gladioli]
MNPMKSKTTILISLICLLTATFAHAGVLKEDFSQYSAKVFTGNLVIPKYYEKTDYGWRDDEGKSVDNPHVNFAGKYFIGRHSCGTECIYFSLSDLTTGKDYNTLDMFSSGGDSPTRTRDGRRYLTELVTKPDSRLLIARYHISASASLPEECKEKEFVLDDKSGKVIATSKVSVPCKIR